MSQNVNVNLVPGNYPKEFHVSQYDVGRQLVANIVDSTGAYSIPSGATVTLVGTKPSGFGFTLSGSVGSGGVVTFSTTATVTAEYGRIPCELRITSGSTILGTANCMLIVEESPHPEGTTDGDGEVVVNQITLLLEQITQQADRIEATLSSYAKVSGEYDGMTVGTAKQLLSDSTTTDTEPYIYRQTAGDGDREEVEEVVGGTVAWNQLVPNSLKSGTNQYADTRALNITIRQYASPYTVAWRKDVSQTGNVSVILASSFDGRAQVFHNGSSRNIDFVNTAQLVFTSNHKYLFSMNLSSVDSLTVGGVVWDNTNIFDLTAMFNPQVADAVYAMEQASAGAGVAWFKKLFNKSYYPYNAGELMSVKTSAHVTKDADENVIGNYPLSPIELRGIPKWVDGKLKFDGDVYLPSGEVQRRYGIVDLGSLNWVDDGGAVKRWRLESDIGAKVTLDKSSFAGLICAKYSTGYQDQFQDTTKDKYISGLNWGSGVIIVDSSYTDAAAFKTAMSGVYLVYEKATATTETVDPYTAIQVCDPNGTEEWTDERTVQIPVGNVTKYHANLKEKLEDLPTIPSAPSANGTYTLKATVSGGAVTYQWVNG